jgi:hypothetical protein
MSRFDVIEPKDGFLEIDSRYLEHSGLTVKSGKNFVYIRKDVEELYASLATVVPQNLLCSVVGAPGAGKSLATFSFACTILDKGYEIIWIHLPKMLEPCYVKFVDGGKAVGTLSSDEQVSALLQTSASDKISLLILDGVTTEHGSIEKICYRWVSKGTNRRLICVASMGSGPRLSDNEMIRLNFFKIRFCSWSRDDYLRAIKNLEFSAQIEPMLDAHFSPSEAVLGKRKSPEQPISMEDKLESKFFFAGSSARAMFDLKTDQIISYVCDYVQRAQNLYGYLSGEMAECSDIAVNHLLSWHPDASGVLRCTPVSGFVARAITSKLGPQMLSNLRKALQADANPCLDGILFEMWVFSKLRVGKLPLKEKSGTTWIAKEWNGSPFIMLNPRGPKPPISNGDTWLKPSRWQQGGYDAVHINLGEKRITFLQITRSESHSFLTEHFRLLLDQIKYVWGDEIKYLSIYFVVPTNRASVCKIQSPPSTGLFTEYHVLGDAADSTWRNGSELSHAKICSVDDE